MSRPMTPEAREYLAARVAELCARCSMRAALAQPTTATPPFLRELLATQLLTHFTPTSKAN